MEKPIMDADPLEKQDQERDINQKLIIDTERIFKEELKTDDSTTTQNQVTNKFLDNNTSNIPDAKWIDEYGRKLLALSSPIVWEYHKSEIDNVDKTIKSILTTTKWVSFATIAIVAVCIVFDKNGGAIISGAVGGIIDTILGILTGVFNSTLKSKKSYFDSESDSTKFNQMLLLVQTVADQDKRDSVIVDILHKFFKVHDK